ncbi:hypothetical protein BC629DRAFT_1726782 [Irpex lacteus]|nr:hypothetical protein BC629DRAFT_1726782 [Irpex lacteus]
MMTTVFLTHEVPQTHICRCPPHSEPSLESMHDMSCNLTGGGRDAGKDIWGVLRACCGEEVEGKKGGIDDKGSGDCDDKRAVRESLSSSKKSEGGDGDSMQRGQVEEGPYSVLSWLNGYLAVWIQSELRPFGSYRTEGGGLDGECAQRGGREKTPEDMASLLDDEGRMRLRIRVAMANRTSTWIARGDTRQRENAVPWPNTTMFARIIAGFSEAGDPQTCTYTAETGTITLCIEVCIVDDKYFYLIQELAIR